MDLFDTPKPTDYEIHVNEACSTEAGGALPIEVEMSDDEIVEKLRVGIGM